MNKKIIGIFLISLFLLSTLPGAFADDKSYSIDFADISLIVNPNGLLNVNETFEYNFNGQFKGVYRDIPLKEGESIRNINVSTEGAYSTYNVFDEDGKKKIKIFLYSDEAKTQPIHDTNVKVHISYDFINLVKNYNDVGELHYKIIGEEWDVPIHQVNAHVKFNSSNGVKYWINPGDSVLYENWNGSTLNFKTDHVNPGDFFEIRAVIPLEQFSNATYVNKINKNGLEEINKAQEDYKNSVNLNNVAYIIFSVLIILSLSVPVIIYYKYGREPKTQYFVEYEREPPTKDSPLFVDTMFGTYSDTGTPSEKGFQATIMDLINRKIFTIVPNPEHPKNIILKREVEDIFTLEEHEIDIINLLEGFKDEKSEIDLAKMKKSLKNSFVASEFKRKYDNIMKDFKNINIDPIFSDYFVDKGARYMKIYAGISIVLGFILYLTPLLDFSGNLGLILIIVGAVSFFLPNRIGGRWTVSGKETYEKWNKFRKFLNDFSLIKDNPPQSVAIWNQYLVYATALGSARKVQKAMGNLVPDALEDNDLYHYQYYGGSALISSVISASQPDSSSDGVSGVGGGSGGGGGGAF